LRLDFSLTAREIERVHRTLSAAERDRLRKVRAEVEQEKDEILALGRRLKREHDAALAELRDALGVLKEARTEQGLSLAEGRDRSGIGRGALCRLENEIEPNPTVATLMRYAHALGKRIVIKLVDEDEPLAGAMDVRGTTAAKHSAN
jgi:hypothetical protein